MVHASILDDRSLIAVGGAEARAFLQGLVSNDMENCGPGRGIYAALLTPQVKILFEFFITEGDERFLIDCAAARAADLLKRLTFYRLRAKIDIAPTPDLAVAAFWGGDLPAKNDQVTFPDPRSPDLGLRWIGRRLDLQRALQGVEPASYRVHHLRLRIPDSSDLAHDNVFDLDARLEGL